MPFFNVVQNGVAILELEPGFTYRKIQLVATGTAINTATHLTTITGKLNGKPIYQTTGARLDIMADYKGKTASAGSLMLDFTEPENKTVYGSKVGGIATAKGVSKFTLEVTLDSAPADITLTAYVDAGPAAELGLINGLVHHPKTISAAGKYPVVLPYGKEAGHLIKRVYFFCAEMTELSVKRNGLMVHDQMSKAQNDYFAQWAGRAPQSNLYVYDPIVTGDIKDVLDTSQADTLIFDCTVSGSTVIDAYADIIGKLENF